MTCKPRPISGNLPFDAIAKDYNRYCGRIIGNGGSLFLQPETIAFAERVIADGGTVEDIGFLNSFIFDAKSNGYFGDIVAAYSPSWGVKTATGASDLYSVIGSTFDLAQSTPGAQPAILPADLNGKTRIGTDGTDDFIGTLTGTWGAVRTVVLMGFTQDTFVTTNRIFAESAGTILRQQSIAGSLRLISLTNDVAFTNSDSLIGSPYHVRSLFNGASSAIQVDNNVEATGDPGSAFGDGFTFGAAHNGSLPTAVTVGAIVLLNSAVDGDYLAKMHAMYTFSQSAYGTS